MPEVALSLENAHSATSRQPLESEWVRSKHNRRLYSQAPRLWAVTIPKKSGFRRDCHSRGRKSSDNPFQIYFEYPMGQECNIPYSTFSDVYGFPGLRSLEAGRESCFRTPILDPPTRGPPPDKIVRSDQIFSFQPSLSETLTSSLAGFIASLPFIRQHRQACSYSSSHRSAGGVINKITICTSLARSADSVWLLSIILIILRICSHPSSHKLILANTHLELKDYIHGIKTPRG